MESSQSTGGGGMKEQACKSAVASGGLCLDGFFQSAACAGIVTTRLPMCLNESHCARVFEGSGGGPHIEVVEKVRKQEAAK